eukprot:TRINITY_DN11021_c3_g1_i1.p1 TRINITY_DN11021_c3_g1~~TRINITY_DN11021_c3_g1_i1.p1  ORF type:complete len:268 (+),score=41.04 TRINITY_DN11021_c3_g1_i1:89-805(+)
MWWLGTSKKTEPTTTDEKVQQWNQTSEPNISGLVNNEWDSVVERDRCEDLVRKGWMQSNHIKFLLQELELMGKKMTLDNIKCVGRNKGTTISGQGGYLWREVAGSQLQQGDIAISSRNARDLRQVSASLRHELIHAFDDARANVDPTNCLHHACSEIRAARLSGECSISEEILRGNGMMSATTYSIGEQCVRRRAALSVSQNPHCSSCSEASVEKVWDKCLSDTAPYMKFPLDRIFDL